MTNISLLEGLVIPNQRQELFTASKRTQLTVHLSSPVRDSSTLSFTPYNPTTTKCLLSDAKSNKPKILRQSPNLTDNSWRFGNCRTIWFDHTCANRLPSHRNSASRSTHWHAGPSVWRICLRVSWNCLLKFYCPVVIVYNCELLRTIASIAGSRTSRKQWKILAQGWRHVIVDAVLNLVQKSVISTKEDIARWNLQQGSSSQSHPLGHVRVCYGVKECRRIKLKISPNCLGWRSMCLGQKTR